MSTRSTLHLVEHAEQHVHVFHDWHDCDPEDDNADPTARVWLEIDASAVEVATYHGVPGGRVTVAIPRELWAALVVATSAGPTRP